MRTQKSTPLMTVPPLAPVASGFQAVGLADAKATVVVETPSVAPCFWIATSGSGVSRFDESAGLWQTYTQADGLANTDVRSMIITRAGDLWFGTANGASYFSPATECWQNFFTTDGLANDMVWSLLEDQSGRIWLGTNGGGLSCFDPMANSWQTYTTTDGLAGNIVQSLLEDGNGTIWVGTKSGLSRFDCRSNEWQNFHQQDGLANNQVRSLTQDSRGNIWIGTVTGLSRLQPVSNQWTTFTTASGLGSNYIQALCSATDGTLWAGTRLGVSCFDATSGRWLTLTQADGLTDNEVWGLTADRQNRLWAATWGGGVSVFNPASDHWQTYTTPTEFADTYALSVIKSGEEHVWIGTYGAISRYAIHSGQWQTLSSAQGLPNDNVQTLAQDKTGTVWVGTSDGLIRYRPGDESWLTLTCADGLPNNNVGALWWAKGPALGDLWIGTAAGLGRYQLQTDQWQYFTEAGLKDADIRSLLIDSNANTWVGTTTGLAVLEADGNCRHYAAADGLLDPQVNALAEDHRGCIWIGTETGLNCLNPTNGHWQSLTQSQGLANNQVRALAVDQDNLWIACAAGGLNRYQLSEQRVDQLGDLGTDDLSSLALDGSGKLWIASAGGGMTWLFRDGNSAGFRQHFTAGLQNFAEQLQLLPERPILGRPGAIATNGIDSPPAAAAVFAVAHNPLLDAAMVNRQTLIWAGSDEAGLSLISLEANRRTAVGNLPSRHLTALSVTPTGNCWIGSAAGIAFVDCNQLRAHAIVEYPQLPCGPVSGLAAVSDGEVYLGFSALNPILFASDAAALSRTKSSIWHVCASAKPEKIHPASSARNKFENCIINNLAWSSRSGLWIATSRGLFLQGPTADEICQVDIQLPIGCSNAIDRVALADNGDVFMLLTKTVATDATTAESATAAVIQLCPETGQTLHWTPAQGLPPAVSSLTIDNQNRLWVNRGCYLFATGEIPHG